MSLASFALKGRKADEYISLVVSPVTRHKQELTTLEFNSFLDALVFNYWFQFSRLTATSILSSQYNDENASDLLGATSAVPLLGRDRRGGKIIEEE